MTEFADVLANDLTAVVYLASAISVLVAAAIAALWIGREPASGPAFVPEFGL